MDVDVQLGDARHQPLLHVGDGLVVNQRRDLLQEVAQQRAGRDDGSLALARAVLGPDKILGTSCYADPDASSRSSVAGADYVAFGAVYPSSTKPQAPPVAVDLFSSANTTFSAATCAIGGITLANAPPLIAAGADMLAVRPQPT